MNWLRKNIFVLLDIFKFVGIMALILMFINFNAKVVTQTKTTQDIVKSQSQILDAIKQLAIDNKITSEQKANLIICMLQVPVSQRTTNTLENCKRQTDNGSVTPSSPSPVPSPAATPTSPSPSPSPSPAPKTPAKSIVKTITDDVRKIWRNLGP